jgi:hypothetical protein
VCPSACDIPVGWQTREPRALVRLILLMGAARPDHYLFTWDDSHIPILLLNIYDIYSYVLALFYTCVYLSHLLLLILSYAAAATFVFKP